MCELGACIDNLLAIIEHDEYSSPAYCLSQGRNQGLRSFVANSERRRERPWNETAVLNSFELDDPYSIGKLGEKSGGSLKGEARLTNSCGSCECDESSRVEKKCNTLDFLHPPNVGRNLWRKICRRRN